MSIDVSIILDVRNIAIILVTALEFALGLAILFRGRERKEVAYFLFLVLAIVFWSVTIGFSRSLFLLDKIEDFLFWRKLSYISALFLPLATVYFFYSFPKEKRRPSFIFSLTGVLLLVLPAIVLFFLILNNYLIEGVIIDKSGGAVQLNFFVYLFFTIYLVGYLGLAFFRLIKNYLQSLGEVKNQLGIVIIGTLTSAIVASTTNLFLPWFKIFDYFWFGPVAMIFMTVVIAYGVVKYQLLNVRLFASEVFTGIIIFILAGEVFFAQNLNELFLRLTVFAIILVFSYFLIKSIYQEIRTREALEKTGQKLQEANIRLKKLDQTKTEFLSLASHQLLTPLSTTKGYLSMILEGSFGQISDKVKEALRRIFLSNERLIKLVDDFLNISRLEMGRVEYKFSKFNLKDLITELKKEHEFRAKEKNLNLKSVFKEKLPEIYTDREKLYQIVSNLVDNAIKYTEKGYVEIKVKFIQDISKFIILVKDTGAGLTSKEKALIFRQFVRAGIGRKTHPQGVGLGLYVVKLLIQGLGGEIWVESEKGKGSTFYLEVPIFPSKTIKTEKEFISLMEKI